MTRGPAMLMLLAACGAAPPPSAPTVTIGFRCKWWSPQQMVGLNPNHPPPKDTEVVIGKWEYSDPVGVPHPDVVDVVVELKNPTDRPLEGLVVAPGLRWRTGPMGAESKAVWGAPAAGERQAGIRLAPGESRTVRIPVDVARKMKQLERTRGWPWALRVSVQVLAAGSAKPLATAQATLPITPGD